MIYVNKADLELIFGVANVERWANLDGDDGPAGISARVHYACEVASGEIEDILRDRRYKFPLTISATLKDLVARMAGLRLHDSRGIIDSEQTPDTVSRIRAEVESKLAKIRNGEIYIEGERFSTAPGVVNDEKSHPNRCPANFDPMRPYFGLRHD